MNELDKISGILYGSAYGDALAAPTEFTRDLDRIRLQFPPNGPTTIHTGRVTDDTQMMLAVARALLDTPELNAQASEGPLRREFVKWLHDPENTRAPGNTCLSACRNLERGGRWQAATIHASKGCGANMRVQAAGIIPDADARAGYAQFQAALTHGHPTALAASDLTAEAIWLLLSGAAPADLPAALTRYARAQRSVYREGWLGELWRAAGYASPEAYIRFGWDECLGVLAGLERAATGIPEDADPCDFTGEGWIAEEAFATGLLCFLLTPDDPVEALRRAAVTSGDSDSLACLAGAFAGAHLGLSAFPDKWLGQIEYGDELRDCAEGLARMGQAVNV
ncbi:ADP-ribosylglycohydrolase family protein [Deinococcus sp.]|uniref:ADP-ribosylglycohydrolase family protein n=1 Tax=Deinococcus sp. TaxID=47478 RepID=UPI0025DAD1D8|nr:ADP-ribosylglycohydrolase family protein [Deinococcus sp.]